MHNYSEYLRERIRQAREDAGLSQYDLAEKYGCTQGTISGIERGRVEISAADLPKIASILRRPISYFYPMADPTMLTDLEQKILYDLRQLPENWQIAISDYVDTQVDLFKTLPKQWELSDELLIDWAKSRDRIADKWHQDKIIRTFKEGRIKFISQAKGLEFGAPLDEENVNEAYDRGFVEETLDLDNLETWEQRLLELWRDGRLEFENAQITHLTGSI